MFPSCLRSRILVLAVLLGAAAWAFAGDKADPHLTTAASRDLFLRSAFAHGYMHGYEEGFHSGDADIQIGRGARDPRSLPEYRKSKSKYQMQFGDKDCFDTGYREGFRAGYADSVQGVPFRAVAQARLAARELQPVKEPVVSFDQGFREGYFGGRVQGLDDGRRQAPYVNNLDFLSDYCRARYEGHHPSDVADFCLGYKRGYAFGYSDGYVNQNPESENAIQVAQKK